MVFTIDGAQTQVTISGKVAGSTFSAQGPGSLTTSYKGTVNVALTSSTIQFPGGSSINAVTNGVWQPAVGGGSGNAPADYGATATIDTFITANATLRNLVFDLTSPTLTLSDGSFNGNSLVFSFIANTATFDYNSSVKSGSFNLNGYSTNTLASGAILSTNAGIRILTIQLNTLFNFTVVSAKDSSIDLTGQLVATNAVNNAQPPPIIESIVENGVNIVVTTENTTAQSLLLVSTNLSTWSVASTTITTNGLGMIVYTSPVSGPQAFYRVQQ